MTPGKRYASSTDVARLAGVSQSAVSRTFTPGASVSAETRRKVLEAAEALGFRPSIIPQILLTDRSGLVAVIVGGLQNAYHSAVLERFATRLRDAGKQVLLVPVDSDYALDAVLAQLSSYRVDAIVSGLAVLSQEVADALSAFRIPIVSFNAGVTSERVASVESDNRASAATAAALLRRRGGRRFAFLAGPEESPASRDRLAGFRDGLAALGLEEPRVMAGDYSYAGGQSAARRLFARSSAGEPADALFCANDLIAFGAMDVIRRELGLRVPEDVMLVGYDNIPSAAWGAYDLTSFDQDAEALVTEALALVEEMTARPPAHGPVRVVPARFVERGSTRRP
ncbi:DNA-binding LacI/PurR family transcriptional regulator [Azospirillum agricola]|uniref:LacI family DNA-binding transcriptional regulator n=1 Tax=Azospirillum agricola TaxID=1720247 RepID=UPI001AE475F2|nr:LacI family DNA-binding transcriptional regulator [Azospirillum agricola]MBP2231983.1 DNA-binding LacI/PurR family transcriptional regulator [Azospirillum agricola]